MLTYRPITALCLAGLLLAGCASSRTVYSVGVNSYRQEAVPSSAKVAVYVDPDDTDLMRWEFKRKVEYLLAKRGFRPVSLTEADYVVFFAYGMGSEMETFTKYVYDPGTPVATSPTPTTGSKAGRAAAAFAAGVAAGTKQMRPQQAQRKVHTRVLKITALDASALRNGEKKVACQVDVTSTGSSADLRRVLNYMAVPALELFGSDSGQSVEFRLDSEDAQVRDLLMNTR